MFFRGYVETKDKQCVEKFKGRTDFKTYEQVKSLPEFAGILAEDTILVDLDDGESSDVLFKVVQDYSLNCRVYRTTRGKHFLFKNSGVNGCKTHCTLAIGLKADIKVGVKSSYEVLKYGGVEHEILYDTAENEQAQPLPRWLFPVRSKMAFLDMEEGDGRNQALFNYILTLQSNDFTVEEARETIRIINKYVLKVPLSDSEIETILRDDSFKKPVFYNGSTFLFDKFAIFLKNNAHIIKINNQLHIYKDGIYTAGYGEIEAAMIKHIPDLNRAKRSEVVDYLDLLIRDNTKPEDAHLIAFKNGLYNIIDGSFVGFTPEHIITNKIPWDYTPDATCPLVDNVLNRLSCNDAEIRALLEEVAGACLYRDNKLGGGKAVILVGDKSNGKSTYIEMLHAMLGDVVANNWSWISPIIGGVTAALMVYYGWQLANNAISLATKGIKIALAVASYAHAAATGAEVTATAAATAAQYSLNTAFLASPVTWVVMGIIALIAVLLAVTNAIAQVTGVTQSGVGIITGVIAVGGAFILNTIISLINNVITLGVSFWNMLANFAAAFGLIFNDPIAAIEVMFLSLFNFIVSIVSSAAGILDTIFGSDLQSAVQGFQDKIQAQINTTVENAGGNKPKTLDPSDYTMDRISYGDAFSMGADFGDGVVGGISDFFNKTFNMDSVAPSVDLSDYTAGIGDGVKDIAGNTGAIKNSLNVSEDELRYLRDIAEQEVINRFTTAEITINQSNENHITNGMDLDGVISALCDGVSEAIEVAAEGIHE